MIVWGFTGAVLDRLLELAGWDRPWDVDDVRDLPQRALDLAARGMPLDFRAPGADPDPEDDGPAADDVMPGGSCPSGDPRRPGTVEW